MAIMPIGSASDAPEEIMDINTTPLIDVMLVLLVMLIITIPIQLHAVKLDLPAVRQVNQPSEPSLVHIDIDANDQVHWQGQALTQDQWTAAMRAAAQQSIPPQVRVHTDRMASYAVFAAVLADTRREGLRQVAVLDNVGNNNTTSQNARN